MTRPFTRLLPLAAVALFAWPSIASAQQPPPGYPASDAYPPTPTNPALASSEDEHKDSGLGLEWVYLNADLGYSYVNMESFSASSLGLAKTSSAGPAFGAAAGVRLLFFTLGVRVRDLDLPDLGSLWELSGEAAFHTRIFRVDPYIGVRGGYNFVGTLSSSTASVATGQTPASASIHGFDVGPMVGLDIYLAKLVSIGVDAEAQFLFLQRPKPQLPGGATVAAECATNATCQTLYNQSGNSVGFGFVPTAHLGIHF